MLLDDPKSNKILFSYYSQKLPFTFGFSRFCFSLFVLLSTVLLLLQYVEPILISGLMASFTAYKIEGTRGKGI